MKDYYKHMKYKHGEHICLYLKHYSKQKQKLAKQITQLKFLLECRRYELTPNYLTNATKNININTTSQKIKAKVEKTKRMFLKKILNLEITQTNMNIKATRDHINYAERKLVRILNETEFNSTISHQNFLSQRITKERESIQTAKLERLKHKQLQFLGICVNSEWFINKTNIDFPEEVKWLLSLGRKFALPTTKTTLDPIKMIAEMEQIIQQIEDERDKEIERSKLSNRIMQFRRNIKNNTAEKFIVAVFNKTKAFLQKHKHEIIVTDSDKGNKTVVIYKKDYREKMNELLKDKNTYRKLRNDPTNTLQKKNNNIVNQLYKNKIISWREKQLLTCSAATAPRLYGLPKIHKPNIPLRPIASSLHVPCYGLSKFIGTILSSLTSEEYNIKNAFRLKDRLQNICIDEEKLLVSFDVVSLFTNIPTNLAIQLIMRKFDKIQQKIHIPRSTFHNILIFCLKDNNYFMYENHIYTQTFGMPMGNPLSPTIADIIMDDLLDKTLTELKGLHNIKIKLIVKYVDDVFAIVRRNDVEIILKTLNKYHEKLQFTMETERNLSIPFLDVRIHGEKEKILLNWYSKPISSGRIINFLSAQPLKYKINTARNLVTKILTISHQRFRHEHVGKIHEILKRNNYPIHMTKNLIEQALMKINKQHNNTSAVANTETKQFCHICPQIDRQTSPNDKEKQAKHNSSIQVKLHFVNDIYKNKKSD
ncbi:uncharacterized protein LOC118757427 [Rhagoletis pomonella]|uniref:uncharacterized protein LOC118757427 n=1 Tax=Rhagoletis pomonella TaxID=28610 RepID=UPI001781843F|nr:uncharacterized protein LOC118757427 [Rhagoletis pomonella]